MQSFRYYLLLVITVCSISTASAQLTDTRCFELRIYYCHPGRLDALMERFTNHTTRLFEKHGMQNIGYWLPVNNTENALYYVLAYPSKEAREASWKAFSEDSTWKGVQRRSEESGKIVARVRSIFMEATGYSPAIQASKQGADRLFELRTYTCYPDKLSNLQERFKNHTCKLFADAGMTNIAYWTSKADDDKKQPTLIYLLAHKSEEAAKKSWDLFRNNPEWIKVRNASEAAGPIVEQIESIFLKPLPFSAIR
ncbi:NIPSNAP family protein [Flavihumibacter sp. CACIAM 22H1]|uniref:NIPSNAP family protein n=1 Tax=Flavihumibacter sp. CACIAM 22H1 TaxID=1812911 RepID=UPI0007A818D8|nr:NIPSNAP family protein [Flavihumibacter sp. CACIAM 22H1]KYP15252.1 MAG: NIPSNAP family containing protein [Flavihumibacter sp. CACIAM 22H1]